MSKLTTIEGIGPALAERLQKSGVTSVEKLLQAGASPAGRKELAAKTGIEPSRLLRFVNHADLMRIKGVGGEYSELLEAAGVDSVPELAKRNGPKLAAKIAEANLAKQLVRAVPSAKAVSDWIGQAKKLGRVVGH